jgi:aminoglycoside 3-N-acetyltransferase
MISFRDVVSGLRAFDLDPETPLIVHASLSSFGEVRGGGEAVLGALLSLFEQVLMPAFTYKTMIIPEDGPPNNGLVYGSGHDLNRMADFFRADLPVDPTIGDIAETLRKNANARRSSHPILSFSGIAVEDALAAQTLSEPLAPIQALTEKNGWVLLLGVDHTVNTSIHYTEALAGRKSFVRWALTPTGIKECPAFPSCSDGFEAAAPLLESITRQQTIGAAQVRAIPLQPMIETLVGLLQKDPLALLCDRADCERCDAVRQALKLPEQS